MSYTNDPGMLWCAPGFVRHHPGPCKITSAWIGSVMRSAHLPPFLYTKHTQVTHRQQATLASLLGMAANISIIHGGIGLFVYVLYCAIITMQISSRSFKRGLGWSLSHVVDKYSNINVLFWKYTHKKLVYEGFLKNHMDY